MSPLVCCAPDSKYLQMFCRLLQFPLHILSLPRGRSLIPPSHRLPQNSSVSLLYLDSPSLPWGCCGIVPVCHSDCLHLHFSSHPFLLLKESCSKLITCLFASVRSLLLVDHCTLFTNVIKSSLHTTPPFTHSPFSPQVFNIPRILDFQITRVGKKLANLYSN